MLFLTCSHFLATRYVNMLRQTADRFKWTQPETNYDNLKTFHSYHTTFSSTFLIYLISSLEGFLYFCNGFIYINVVNIFHIFFQTNDLVTKQLFLGYLESYICDYTICTTSNLQYKHVYTLAPLKRILR